MASITFTSGGGITTTNAVTRDAGGAWIKARDNCVARSTRTSSQGADWHPVIGCKTSSGFWSLGSVGGETLCFSYDTDANYNAGSNTSKVLYIPAVSATILTTAGGTCSGAISAPSFNATSSRTKKKNITDSDLNAVELLNNVKIVNYVLKDDEDKTPRIGFIAEDTDSLLSTPKHDHMDMGNCIGVLIKAVQELSSEVEALKKKAIEKGLGKYDCKA